MARTNLAITTLVGAYPAEPLAADALDINFDAADATASPDGNKFQSTGRELLLARNVGASSRNITITAQGEPATTITNYSLGAGEQAIFGPFPVKGWRQRTGANAGYVTVNAAHAEVELAVLRVRSIR